MKYLILSLCLINCKSNVDKTADAWCQKMKSCNFIQENELNDCIKESKQSNAIAPPSDKGVARFIEALNEINCQQLKSLVQKLLNNKEGEAL